MGMWTYFLSLIGVIKPHNSHTIVFIDVDKAGIPDLCSCKLDDPYRESARLSLEVSGLSTIGVLQDYIRSHLEREYRYPHTFQINTSSKLLLSRLMKASKTKNLLAYLKKCGFTPDPHSPNEITIQISTCPLEDFEKYGLNRSEQIKKYRISVSPSDKPTPSDTSATVDKPSELDAESKAFRRKLLLWASKHTITQTDKELLKLDVEERDFVLQEIKSATSSRAILIPC